MSNIRVISHQSLLDLANQETGSIETAFDWAVENSISVTEILEPGRLLKVPKSEFISTEIASYFKRSKKSIATGLTKYQAENIDEEESFGIGSMAIGSTFIVR